MTRKRYFRSSVNGRARSAITLIALGLLTAVAVQLWPVQSASASVARFGTPSPVQGASFTSISITKPAGATASHLLIATVTINGTGTASTDQICPPSGWTSIVRTTNTGIVQEVFQKFGSDAGPYSFDLKAISCSGATITRRAAAGINAYSGVDSSTPIAGVATSASGTSTTATTNSFTTATGNFLVATVGVNGSKTFSPSGVSLVYSNSGGTGSPPQGPSTFVGDAVLACTAATSCSSGTKSASFTGSEVWIANLFALKRANVAPTANTTGPFTLNEDAVNSPVTLIGSDADTENCTLDFSIVTAPTNGSLGVSISNNSCISGSPNTDSAIVTYTPNANYNGSDSFTYKVNDGLIDSAVSTVALTINAVNDAPVNTVPGAQTTNEDTAVVFSSGNSNQISIADVDAGASSVQVTLGVANGTLTLGGTTGLIFSVGDGTADPTMTFTGTVANINAALATLTYNPTSNFNGVDTLSLTTNDQGNTGSGGALSDIDNVVLTVNAINDAPVNTVPGAQTANEDTAKVFSAGNSNQISIADVDAGASGVQVTLGVANGTLTLSGTTGLTFSVGDGTADATMTFTGTVADINTALATVTYNPTANFNGLDTLSLTTNDQGNTGTGGALSDIDNVVITVNSVNDAPAGTNATVGTMLNTPYVFSAADFGFSDPIDSPPNSLLAVKITTLPALGTLKLSGVDVTLGQSIPVASIPNLTFTPATGGSGSPYTTFTFQVQDDGGTANGGVDLDQSPNTITVNVTALPTLTVIKQVVNNNGQSAAPADFTITVNATNVSQPSFPGQDTPGVTVTFDPGAYSVTESGPFDYAGSFSSGCSGSLSNGQSATCTITNDDLPLDCSQPTMVGTAGADNIVGTAGNDVIDGLGGSDIIRGLGGRDVLCGGPDGETLIDGGTGDDILWGGTGNDNIRGGDGIDRLFGEDGFDDLDGQLGVDLVFGSGDNDFVKGGGDTDFVFGGFGIDTLQGNAADDALFGEAGSDSLSGNDGNDYLFGGTENDNLSGGIGTDECHGEDGTGDTASTCEVVDGVP